MALLVVVVMVDVVRVVKSVVVEGKLVEVEVVDGDVLLLYMPEFKFEFVFNAATLFEFVSKIKFITEYV